MYQNVGVDSFGREGKSLSAKEVEGVVDGRTTFQFMEMFQFHLYWREIFLVDFCFQLTIQII